MSDSVDHLSRLAPGYRLDRYELLCPIAEGGMAAVWLARFQGKHGFEKLVVVKTILPLFANDVQFRRMFLDEATIASRIEHNNVAQILDLGEQDGTLYLVMEWIEGDSIARLDRVVHKRTAEIPQAIALRIISDACAGLHAAHELCDAAGSSLAVVHRDVSPQNILLSSKGVVKVIDFGIAKARHRAAEATLNGVFKGKLHYMAPEQALGKMVDRRADVWSIGAVLYRLLAQRCVYETGTRAGTFQSLTTNEPIRALPAQVPQSVAAIITKALSFDPDARHASCLELQCELEAAMRSQMFYVTPIDLAAFVNAHLAERFEVRRQEVVQALHTVGVTELVSDLAAKEPSVPHLHDGKVSLLLARAAPLTVDGSFDQASDPGKVWAPPSVDSSRTAGSTTFDPRRVGLERRRRQMLAVAALATVAVLSVVFLLHGTAPEPIRPTAQGSGESETAPAPTAPVAVAPTESAHATEPVSPASSIFPIESLPLSKVSRVPVTRGKSVSAAPVAARGKPRKKVYDDGF